MKTYQIVRDIIIIAAISVLFFLFFSNKKDSAQALQNKDESSLLTTNTDTSLPNIQSTVIAYVNIDTLINHYDFYQELRDRFTRKQQKLETEFNQKQQALQEKQKDLEYKWRKRLIMKAEAEKKYNELMQENAQLQQEGQEISMKLSEEEQVLLNKIMDKISSYLNDVNEKYRYK
ncbi:MAG: OmpH family outer membrane protein, partial [Bacteroidota bacterium]